MKHKLSLIIIILLCLFPLAAQTAGVQFSVPSEAKNLFYSQNTRTFYFSIASDNPDKNGFYYKTENLPVALRLYSPKLQDVQNQVDQLILNSATPDYRTFFDYLYSFADYGTTPVFAFKDESGAWLFEEEVLKNLIGYSEEYGWHYDIHIFFENYSKSKYRFMLEKFLFDKSKGFEKPVSAFTFNGHPELLDSLAMYQVREGFFIENDNGIWYVEKGSTPNLKSFITSDNKFVLSNVKELDGYKLEYSPSAVKTLRNAIIFRTKNQSYIFYNTTEGTVLEFSDEAQLNKYLKKLEYQTHPIFKALLAFCLVMSAVAVFLLMLLVIPKLIFAINQKNPLKRKYSFTQKELNKKIFGIQETERRKISRDIHDSVIQDIRVLGIESDLIKVPENDKVNSEHKKKIQQISTDCIIKLRNICYNLAPAELSGHSEEDSSKVQLVSMLNTLSSQFTLRTHIPCSVKVKDDFNYPPFEHEVTENLFRIVQEALTNTEKHAYATEVSIFIKSRIIDQKEYMIIYISDDGVGCDTKELNLRNDSHRGLRNMKERMDLIGGKIEFFSKPNEGLQVILTIEVR